MGYKNKINVLLFDRETRLNSEFIHNMFIRLRKNIKLLK